MSLYKEFSTLFPYLQSVRKIKTYLSFDISFPNTWKLPKKYVDEKKVMEQTTTIQNERLFSFVCEIIDKDKLKFIQEIKKHKKEDLVPKKVKLSLWTRIKKVLMG